jgi:hypothetical protein
MKTDFSEYPYWKAYAVFIMDLKNDLFKETHIEQEVLERTK